MAERAVLLLFVGAIFLCVTAGRSVVLALLFGYVLFCLYGISKKVPFGELLRLSWEGIWQVKNVMITYFLVGILTALWRASGTIPVIIQYALHLLNPKAFILIAFLLCAMISVLTGTALGSVATMGVICMTIGKGMGLDPIFLGGAILSGVRVGDRCSPMSSSALLVCSITGTDIYANIKNMIRTSAVPLALSCGIYWAAGLFQRPHAATADVGTLFQEFFVLSPLAVLPAVLVMVLALLRVDVKRTMLASICLAGWVALTVQHMPVRELLRTMVWGFYPEDGRLSALLSGGGVQSMANVLAIVLVSAPYAAIFRRTGLLTGLQRRLDALGQRITPYGALLVTAVFIGIITCGQSLTIILTCQLCGGLLPERSRMAAALEDTAAVIPCLIPWSVAAAVPLAAVSAPMAALLAACYPYLLPLWHFVSQRFVREEPGERG